LATSLDREVLNLFELYRFVAFGMGREVVRQKRAPVLKLMQLERL